MTENNPLIDGKANKPMSKVSREDCYWDSREENVLFDTYLILRDAGYTKKELKPLGEILKNTTIYNQEQVEKFYKQYVQ